jgi:hypothetical protein
MQGIGNRLPGARFVRLHDQNARRLAQVLRAEGDGLLVLAGDSPLAQQTAIRQLLELTRNPVLLIR